MIMIVHPQYKGAAAPKKKTLSSYRLYSLEKGILSIFVGSKAFPIKSGRGEICRFSNIFSVFFWNAHTHWNIFQKF